MRTFVEKPSKAPSGRRDARTEPGARGHSLQAHLARHPFPIETTIRHTLALTYAFPPELLKPLLPPGLKLYCHRGWAFLAVALVDTRHLRPAGFPATLGLHAFHVGYRILAQFKTRTGRTLKGLKILESRTDSPFLAAAASLFTRYGYRRAQFCMAAHNGILAARIVGAEGKLELDVEAEIDLAAEAPPVGSPFESLAEARRFAGPLPFTFEAEPETGAMIVVQGVRHHWNPMPVRVQVNAMSILQNEPFVNYPDPPLANAFYVGNVPYRWERGVREEIL